jgi:cytochrome c oxidase cbb3-type subunit 4
METYIFLREVAGSFGLVWMFIIFVAIVIWVMTGRRKSYQDTAEIIFRNEDGPAQDDEPRPDDPGRDNRKEARS